MLLAVEWWDNFQTYVDESIFGIPALNYLIAFSILLIAMLTSRVFSYLLINYVLRFAKNTRYKFDQLLVESLRRPLSWGFLLLGIFFATLVFTKQVKVEGLQVDLDNIQLTIRNQFEKEPLPQDPRFREWSKLDGEKSLLVVDIEALELKKTESEKAVTDKEQFIAGTYPVIPDEETPEHAAYTEQSAELDVLKEAVKTIESDLQGKKARSEEIATKLKEEFEEKPNPGDTEFDEYEVLVQQEDTIKSELRMRRGANVWLGRIKNSMTKIIRALSAIWVFWILFNLVDIISFYLRQMAGRTGGKLDDQLVPMIRKSLRFFIVCMGALVAFQNLGYSVTSVLAGLGLGGLAFALAAKDTIGNFFGSVTVILDRPFQVGDWIQIGSNEGTVEEVGFRSTRIRTFYDSQIVIPNAEMANATIENWSRRRYRRKSLTLGLTYDTPAYKVEAFCEGLRELIRILPYTRKDYFHVYFNNFNASSLDVMLYVFVKVPDWSTELREWHRLFLCTARLAETLGVEFAFPTQTLHIAEGLPAAATTTPSVNSNNDVPPPGNIHEAHTLGRDAARKVYKELNENDIAAIPPPVDFSNNDSVLSTYFGTSDN